MSPSIQDSWAVPPSKHNAPAGVAAQLPTSPRRWPSIPRPPHPRPTSQLPGLTYTSAFATCVGVELVPGWTRCRGSVLGLASRSQPQLQPLLLRSVVLPPLPALSASSQLVCIFRAAWRAGHGSRWGLSMPALKVEERSRRLPLQAASRWHWGFCARTRGPRRAALNNSAGSPPPSAGHHEHCGWTDQSCAPTRTGTQWTAIEAKPCLQPGLTRCPRKASREGTSKEVGRGWTAQSPLSLALFVFGMVWIGIEINMENSQEEHVLSKGWVSQPTLGDERQRSWRSAGTLPLLFSVITLFMLFFGGCLLFFLRQGLTM